LIVNRICSLAQKGFNNQRYTQECLINIIETIQHCHRNNVEGAVVAVDMAKACDTLSHGFSREVFRFFYFGPNIINWLSLLGENRTSCILLTTANTAATLTWAEAVPKGTTFHPTPLILRSRFSFLKLNWTPVSLGFGKTSFFHHM
jgi:hypothetical protein